MTTRAALYARQSVREDEGMERQLARMQKLVKARSWEALPAYEDNETSATKPRGPKTAWARLLRDIDDGKVDVVVAVNLDRLLRGIGDLHELLKRDVQVVTLEGELDLTTEEGELQATVLAAAARFEVRRKSARAAASAVTRRAAGHPSAGRVPYGYRWVKKDDRDKKGTRYVQEPNEAKVVRAMFDEALDVPADQLSVGAIVRDLGERAPGVKWNKSTVRRMLLSPLYAALVADPMPLDASGHRLPYVAEKVDLDKCQPGAWEPIVTTDELRVVREKLMRAERRTNGGTTARKWLLSGLALCSVCGTPIRSAVTREGHRGYRCKAGHFQRRAEPIDAFVTEAVVARLAEPVVAAVLETPSNGVDVPALRLRRDAIQVRRREVLALVASGRYTAAEADPLVGGIDTELGAVNAELAQAEQSNPVLDLLAADDIRARWDGLSLARRRAVLGALAVIYLTPVGKGRSPSGAELEDSVVLLWGVRSTRDDLRSEAASRVNAALR